MIKQDFLLLSYNKGVICIIDKGKIPECNVINSRRSEHVTNNHLPSYDPYIPREYVMFYNCTNLECKTLKLNSIMQVTSPDINLKSCFIQSNNDYVCENIRYNYLKNIDKLLFLTSNIPNKIFYLVDCLVYASGARICHKKDGKNSHTMLIDTGNIVKPSEPNILSQDEFICEEDAAKLIHCDLNPYVPYNDELKQQEYINSGTNVLLKTGSYVVRLHPHCTSTEAQWCGFVGSFSPTRRSRYEDTQQGGKVFRCYYSKKQQICRQVIACGAFAALDGYTPQQDPDQFHIQTDDDDERYFLYQTHNGQYRKERRLKDGSVVGSTGWVGADGYLRLQDYIADDQGYRIYKSKTVYVGKNRPISESLNIAKTAPTDSGYAVTSSSVVNRNRGHSKFSTVKPHSKSTSYNYPNEISITPPTRSYPTATPTPQVYISPNSIESSTKYDFRPTVSPITASEASSSPNPYSYDSNNLNRIDDDYSVGNDPDRRYDIYNPNSYRHADQALQRHRNEIRVGNGYTPQFPLYDGTAFVRNGFRYYLPKQYHEEDNGDEEKKIGSFGYVDPFGIRRVIYYNTGPGEGFQIRQNNRYVGHNGTPYDPRPVD